MMDDLRKQTEACAAELIAAAGLEAGDILVVGCSTSEIMGKRLGSAPSDEAAAAVFAGLYPLLQARGVWLAAQCCEHLNRALIVSEKCAKERGYETVNVCPQIHAGGSFATVTYENLENAVVVEHIKADAGIDIGNTLIGMHLKEVAVPVRLSISKIGRAPIVCARTRLKYIGGERAAYIEERK